jgi:hypothetical protein
MSNVAQHPDAVANVSIFSLTDLLESMTPLIVNADDLIVLIVFPYA